MECNALKLERTDIVMMEAASPMLANRIMRMTCGKFCSSMVEVVAARALLLLLLPLFPPLSAAAISMVDGMEVVAVAGGAWSFSNHAGASDAMVT